ncbi:MAG: stage III sporulation protein AD [Ruminococcaceae bacterium]|nr:stage III sporulation protein AD [Oscillospiraceae bacterium]
MNIISICALAIVSAILSLALKRHNSELSILISIGATVIILLSVIEYVLSSIETVSTILAQANINSEYIMILLKVMGVCFITEFTCDCTKEAGLLSLSSNIALAGKIIVLITALPMFENVLSVVTSLSGGGTIE